MPGTTYMLEDFVAAQEEAVGVARAKLANFREAVVGVALSTCKVEGLDTVMYLFVCLFHMGKAWKRGC